MEEQLICVRAMNTSPERFTTSVLTTDKGQMTVDTSSLTLKQRKRLKTSYAFIEIHIVNNHRKARSIVFQ